MHIRPYQPTDETQWVRCRTLAFLDTAYYDDVYPKKERYENPALELVAVADGQIVGLIDVEIEPAPGAICRGNVGIGGMIWHIGVHPDYRRRGIATGLLQEAQALAKARGIHRFEAWTRDDAWVRAWYERSDFAIIYTYLHVYADNQIQSDLPDLHPQMTFAHYVGDEPEKIKAMFERVYECCGYEVRF